MHIFIRCNHINREIDNKLNNIRRVLILNILMFENNFSILELELSRVKLPSSVNLTYYLKSDV